jgi:ankyrin repeat protein
MTKARNDGFAPVHIACQNGRYASLVVMADAGADLNLPTADKYRNTPATFCCQDGHVNCLAFLGDRGANMSKTNIEGTAPAHMASQNGHLKCLQLLARRGVELNKKDEEGHTPLDITRAFKHLECIDLLLASGATGSKFEDHIPVQVDQKVCIAAYIDKSLSEAVCSVFTLLFTYSVHAHVLLRKRLPKT